MDSHRFAGRRFASRLDRAETVKVLSQYREGSGIRAMNRAAPWDIQPGFPARVVTGSLRCKPIPSINRPP